MDLYTDSEVKVICDRKIAKYMKNKGYFDISFKSNNKFICPETNQHCDRLTVFVFKVEGDFYNDLEQAYEFYNKDNLNSSFIKEN